MAAGRSGMPRLSRISRARARRTSGDFCESTAVSSWVLPTDAAKTASRTTTDTNSARASAGRICWSLPAAATISGEGVSPAAMAAASGSPPGSAAATCAAEDGRCAGSFSMQRRIARSTAGSISLTSMEGEVGGSSTCCLR